MADADAIFINARVLMRRMKLVAFTDVHESLTARRRIEALIKKESPDVAVCAGDFTVFEQHLEEMMDWLQKLPVPVLLINGNHEEDMIVKKMSGHRDNIAFIHHKAVLVSDTVFLGWGGGGFDVVDHDFDHFTRAIAPKIQKAEKIVLVTHGPPHGNKLDYLYREHVGNKSYASFIRKHANVVLSISGHLHENFEKEDSQHRAKLVNPGPNGKVLVI